MKSVINAITLGMGLVAVNCAAQEHPKNIIFMIGDGMGPAYISAHRYAQAGTPGNVVKPTVFDELLVGGATTYPADDTFVTDSAASATALATGIKSYNGAIGVDRHKKPIDLTLLSHAKHQGKATGMVSTSQINHATPASFIAKHQSRRAYQEIASQLATALTQGQVDLLFGGGRSFFQADQLQQANINSAYSWQEFDALTKLPAAALLADVALPYALDVGRDDRLALMTDKATSMLSSNDKGFTLMVEGSMIDWCGHANDIACAIAEMNDFANAVSAAKAFVDRNPDTLLVVTADHSTGGLTLGANGEYQWLPAVVAGVHATGESIAEKLLAGEQTAESFAKVWGQYVDFALEETELTALVALPFEQRPLARAINHIVAKRSYTGWTTSGHTAVDVPVMAYGAGAEQFIGMQDNTELAQKLIALIEQK